MSFNHSILLGVVKRKSIYKNFTEITTIPRINTTCMVSATYGVRKGNKWGK